MSTWIEDLVAYAAAHGGGTATVDLFALKLPATPSAAAAILPYLGGSGFRTFQAAPAHDVLRFQVIVRSASQEPGDDLTAFDRLMTFFRLFDRVVETAMGGTRVIQIEGIQAPFSLGRDPNECWEGATNFEMWRAPA